MKLKSRIALLFIAGSLFCLTPSVYAHPDNKDKPKKDKPKKDKPNKPKPPKGDKHRDVPFDGGITMLVGAGVAYGIKRARDSRKKQ